MLEIKNIYKTYTSTNGVSCRALENVSLKFEDKGIVFILGKSGSGKSTLLNIIGGLDKYDRGQILYNGDDFSSFTDSDFENYRNIDVGFVFQDFSLLDNLTVFENVKLALSLKQIYDDNLVFDALEKVGIKDIAYKQINELTGGQKQRVAIARGIVKKAKIILADEPTGSLDSENSKAIMDLLISQSKQSLVIIVTHNKELALSYGTRIIEIKDGFVLKDMAISSNNKERKMIYSSSVYHLPKGKDINKKDIDEINNIMSNKRQDYFFLVENDKKRLASMYPNLKEVFIGNEHDNKYAPYVFEDNSKHDYVKEKAKGLTYKESFKLGKTLVNKRKRKLSLAIIILTFAMVIMGAISNFSTYSLYNAISYSLKQDNRNYLEISSSFSVSDSQYKIQNKDVNTLNDLGYDFAKNYDINLTLATTGDFKLMKNHGNDELFGNRFTGFIETDNIDLYGYELISQKENLTEEDLTTGVNISSTVAYTMIYYMGLNSIDELLGKKLKVGGYSTYIIGIFDSDYEYYSKIKEATGAELTKIKSEFNSIKDDVILKLVVSSSFMDTYIENYQEFSKTVTCITSTNKDVSVHYENLVDASKLNITTNINAFFFDDSITKDNFKTKVVEFKENEILVGRDVYKALIGEYFSEDDMKSAKLLIEQYNNQNHSLLIKRYDNEEDKELFYTIENVQIKGVFTSYTGLIKYTTIYIGHEYFVNIAKEFFKPTSLKISLENKNIKKAVNDLYNNGFVINNDFVSSFVSLSTLLEKLNVVIDLVLVIWLVLMATLFYSFMSKSITDNKRRIGILKALGAKGNDIYKIFMYEAILLGSISLVLGILSYCGLSLLINYLLSISKGYYFSLFIINFKTIILMTIPTIIVLLFALYIPIKKANSIKPIEVMNRE